jgi:GTP-binding protein
MVGQFFQTRQGLRGVVQLIDVRHPPTAEDQRTRGWLLQWQRPLLIVATKVDKIGRSQRPSHLKRISETLKLDAASPVMVFSAQTGEGREKIWEWISGVMGL